MSKAREEGSGLTGARRRVLMGLLHDDTDLCSTRHGVLTACEVDAIEAAIWPCLKPGPWVRLHKEFTRDNATA